jgi:hypothetical protein
MEDEGSSRIALIGVRQHRTPHRLPVALLTRTDAAPLALRGPLPPGRAVAAPHVRGYYLDFRAKTETPVWPPPWFPWPGFHRYMGIAQWGLGAFERHVLGEGEAWLAAAAGAAEHLVERQRHASESGAATGTWPEPHPYAHTFRTGGNWLSAMAQGQCASLLVRVGIATGDERYLEAAVSGLRVLGVPSTSGGVQARLGDGIFFEEYPTQPPSYVLNGAIFAVWGAYDVWRATGDRRAGHLFVEATETLAAHVSRWDTGFWSRYDLHPHRIKNVASPSYHTLHIDQLTALAALRPLRALADAAAAFRRYADSRSCLVRAVGWKLGFRAVVRKGSATRGQTGGANVRASPFEAR